MSECTHNWTEPPECPACVLIERDKLLRENEWLREALQQLKQRLEDCEFEARGLMQSRDANREEKERLREALKSADRQLKNILDYGALVSSYDIPKLVAERGNIAQALSEQPVNKAE